MGVLFISIYAHELITEYGAKNLIRVGSAGSYQREVKLRDSVLAMAASSTSGINQVRFGGADFAPTADYGLFQQAVETARTKRINIKAGNVLTSNEFYGDEFESYQKWSNFGVLCVEMETSDSLVTGEKTSSKERETTFKEMVEIALELG